MRFRLANLTVFFTTIKNNFFLRKHIPQATTIQLLKNLYPSVDWQRVDFYEGLPWFTPLVAPLVTAQALPHFYSSHRFCIYLKQFDESRVSCLSDLVHEGFHIMQAMLFINGYGFGFFRGLMVYYNALFLKSGYRLNPIEIPAYEQEFRFMQYCEKHGIREIVPKEMPPSLMDIKKESTLVFKSYSFNYKGSLIYLLAGIIFCLLVAFLKPVVDLLLFFIRFFVPASRPARGSM